MDSFMLFFLGVYCLIPIIVILIGVLIGVWVYRDAKRRNMDAILWLIVVLVGNLVGFIVYLIIRKDHPVLQ